MPSHETVIQLNRELARTTNPQEQERIRIAIANFKEEHNIANGNNQHSGSNTKRTQPKTDKAPIEPPNQAPQHTSEQTKTKKRLLQTPSTQATPEPAPQAKKEKVPWQTQYATQMREQHKTSDENIIMNRFIVGPNGPLVHSASHPCNASVKTYISDRLYLKETESTTLDLCRSCKFPVVSKNRLLGPIYTFTAPETIAEMLIRTGTVHLFFTPDYHAALSERVAEHQAVMLESPTTIQCAILTNFLSKKERVHHERETAFLLRGIANGGRIGFVHFDPICTASNPQVLVEWDFEAPGQSAHVDTFGPGVYSGVFNVGLKPTTSTHLFPKILGPPFHSLMEGLGAMFAAEEPSSPAQQAIADKLVTSVLATGSTLGQWANSETGEINPGDGVIFRSNEIVHNTVLPKTAEECKDRKMLFFAIVVEKELWPTKPHRQAAVFDTLTLNEKVDRPGALYWSTEAPVAFDGQQVFCNDHAMDWLDNYTAAEEEFKKYDA
jgi:hypothetical protein